MGREPDAISIHYITMEVDELRNEALVCLHRASQCGGDLEAVKLRKQAARLISAADLYDSGGALILGDQGQLRAA
jgi:hypothetical protein